MDIRHNHHLICLPQHAPKIIDGTKTTTIRSPRSRPIAVGDTITFARWTAKPYRSKQERVRVVTVTSVRTINTRRCIGYFDDIIIDGDPISAPDAKALAIGDGFESITEIVDYLTSEKQPEFSGFIYGWEAQVLNCHPRTSLKTEPRLKTLEVR